MVAMNSDFLSFFKFIDPEQLSWNVAVTSSGMPKRSLRRQPGRKEDLETHS